MLFLSWAVWYWKNIHNLKDEKPKLTYQVLIFFFAVLFVLVLFKTNFTKEAIVFVSSLFYFVAFVGYFLKRTWYYKYFEYLLLSSLIVLFLAQLLFLNFSKETLDTMYVMSEIFKVIGYAISLTGLLMSTYNAFMLVEKYGKTSEARLTASIDSLPIGYVLTDENDEVIKVNKEVFNIFPQLPNTKQKYNFYKVLNIQDRCRQCRVEKCSLEESMVSYNDRFLRLLLTPVYVGNDTVGTVILIQDITEAKLLDKTKDEFIALASHELRTPVSTIKGNSELIYQMFEKYTKNESFKEIVDDIHKSSLRLIDIIEEFLDVSSLEQKKIEFKKEKLNLKEIVKESVKSFENTVSQKGLYLRFEEEAEEIEVLADEVRIKQVLYNLISNSIKFTQKGGISIKAYKKGQLAYVTIKDSGRGISEKGQKMLFKKFQQVGEDFLKHDSTQGVGLGLYISEILVKAMGGSIYLVKSKEGEGSVFEFSLPLVDH